MVDHRGDGLPRKAIASSRTFTIPGRHHKANRRTATPSTTRVALLGRTLLRATMPAATIRLSTFYTRRPALLPLRRLMTVSLRIVATTYTSIPYTMSDTFLMWPGTKFTETVPTCGGRPLVAVVLISAVLLAFPPVYITVPGDAHVLSLVVSKMPIPRKTFFASFSCTAASDERDGMPTTWRMVLCHQTVLLWRTARAIPSSRQPLLF